MPDQTAVRIGPAMRRDVTIAEGVRTIALAMLAALLFRSFAYEPFNIPSGSMLPKLMAGDYMLVAKWPYGFSRHSLPLGLPVIPGKLLPVAPVRGDVVVFREPGRERFDLVKRVIGLPGDHIQMRDGVLHINGAAVALERLPDFIAPDSGYGHCRPSPDGCAITRYRETLPGGLAHEILDLGAGTPGDDTGVFIVPAGRYFMMGDNRDDSLDSRFSAAQGGFGFVPAENLIGRASVLFFSSDGSASLAAPQSWLPAVRTERIGLSL